MRGTERMTPAEYRRELGLPEKPGDEAAPAKPKAEAKRAARRDEDALQRAVVEWLELALRPGVRYWHTPNGGARSKIEAAILKGLGVKAGVPDLAFAWSEELYTPALRKQTSRIAFLELKRPGGSLTAQQREFRAWCLDSGIPWEQASSPEEAMATVKRWGLTREAR